MSRPTRARDLLVVPAIGDGKQEGWLSPLNRAIYPDEDRIRRAAPAGNCPEFGDRTVVARPRDFDNQPEFSVMPGLHRPSSGSHEVVWWDPAALRLGVEENFGVRQQQILSDKVDASPQLAALQQWQEHREAALAKGAIPQCRPIATTLAGCTSRPCGGGSIPPTAEAGGTAHGIALRNPGCTQSCMMCR